MDRISNADRLVLLLRQRLQERARAASAGPARTAAPTERMGIRALAAVDSGDERALRRALIQNLLADQLGPELVNDAQFQQIVTRVTDAIESDPTTGALLNQLVEDLISGG